MNSRRKHRLPGMNFQPAGRRTAIFDMARNPRLVVRDVLILENFRHVIDRAVEDRNRPAVALEKVHHACNERDPPLTSAAPGSMNTSRS